VLISTTAHSSEDVEEKVDDVQVEHGRSVDVLLWRDLRHDLLGVVDDVERKEYGAHRT